MVLTALDKPVSLKLEVPDRPGHDRGYALDWSKIRRELGWQPRCPSPRASPTPSARTLTIDRGGSPFSTARR